ncbi:hypothetical protein AAMO2058_000253800 [Amorphochlora amoebiformis]
METDIVLNYNQWISKLQELKYEDCTQFLSRVRKDLAKKRFLSKNLSAENRFQYAAEFLQASVGQRAQFFSALTLLTAKEKLEEQIAVLGFLSELTAVDIVEGFGSEALDNLIVLIDTMEHAGKVFRVVFKEVFLDTNMGIVAGEDTGLLLNLDEKHTLVDLSFLRRLRTLFEHPKIRAVVAEEVSENLKCREGKKDNIMIMMSRVFKNLQSWISNENVVRFAHEVQTARVAYIELCGILRVFTCCRNPMDSNQNSVPPLSPAADCLWSHLGGNITTQLALYFELNWTKMFKWKAALIKLTADIILCHTASDESHPARVLSTTELGNDLKIKDRTLFESLLTSFRRCVTLPEAINKEEVNQGVIAFHAAQLLLIRAFLLRGGKSEEPLKDRELHIRLLIEFVKCQAGDMIHAAVKLMWTYIEYAEDIHQIRKYRDTLEDSKTVLHRVLQTIARKIILKVNPTKDDARAFELVIRIVRHYNEIVSNGYGSERIQKIAIREAKAEYWTSGKNYNSKKINMVLKMAEDLTGKLTNEDSKGFNRDKILCKVLLRQVHPNICDKRVLIQAAECYAIVPLHQLKEANLISLGTLLDSIWAEQGSDDLGIITPILRLQSRLMVGAYRTPSLKFFQVQYSAEVATTVLDILAVAAKSIRDSTDKVEPIECCLECLHFLMFGWIFQGVREVLYSDHGFKTMKILFEVENDINLTLSEEEKDTYTHLFLEKSAVHPRHLILATTKWLKNHPERRGGVVMFRYVHQLANMVSKSNLPLFESTLKLIPSQKLYESKRFLSKTWNTPLGDIRKIEAARFVEKSESKSLKGLINPREEEISDIGAFIHKVLNKRKRTKMKMSRITAQVKVWMDMNMKMPNFECLIQKEDSYDEIIAVIVGGPMRTKTAYYLSGIPDEEDPNEIGELYYLFVDEGVDKQKLLSEWSHRMYLNNYSRVISVLHVEDLELYERPYIHHGKDIDVLFSPDKIKFRKSIGKKGVEALMASAEAQITLYVKGNEVEVEKSKYVKTFPAGALYALASTWSRVGDEPCIPDIDDNDQYQYLRSWKVERNVWVENSVHRTVLETKVLQTIIQCLHPHKIEVKSPTRAILESKEFSNKLLFMLHGNDAMRSLNSSPIFPDHVESLEGIMNNQILIDTSLRGRGYNLDAAFFTGTVNETTVALHASRLLNNSQKSPYIPDFKEEIEDRTIDEVLKEMKSIDVRKIRSLADIHPYLNRIISKPPKPTSSWASLATGAAVMRLIYYFLIASSDDVREICLAQLRDTETIRRLWQFVRLYRYGISSERASEEGSFGIGVKLLLVLQELVDLNSKGVKECLNAVEVYDQIVFVVTDILKHLTTISNSMLPTQSEKSPEAWVGRCDSSVEEVMSLAVDTLFEVIREASSLTFYTTKKARIGNAFCRTQTVRSILDHDRSLLYYIASLLAYDGRICLHGISNSKSAVDEQTSRGDHLKGFCNLDVLRLQLIKLLGEITFFDPSSHYEFHQFCRKICIRNMVTIRESLIADTLKAKAWTALRVHIQDQFYRKEKLIFSKERAKKEIALEDFDGAEVVEEVQVLERNGGAYLFVMTNLRFYISRSSMHMEIREPTPESITKMKNSDWDWIINSLDQHLYSDVRAVYQACGGQDLAIHIFHRNKSKEVRIYSSLRLGVCDAITKCLRRYCTDDLGRALVDPLIKKTTDEKKEKIFKEKEGKQKSAFIDEEEYLDSPQARERHASQIEFNERDIEKLQRQEEEEDKQINDYIRPQKFFEHALGSLAKRAIDYIGTHSRHGKKVVCMTDVMYGDLDGIKWKTTAVWFRFIDKSMEEGSEANILVIAEKDNSQWKSGSSLISNYTDYFRIREVFDMETLSTMNVKATTKPSILLISENRRKRVKIQKQMIFACDTALQIWRRNVQGYLKRMEGWTSVQAPKVLMEEKFANEFGHKCI